MERAGCGSLSSCVRTNCAGTGNLSAALILQACRGGTGLATQLMAAGKADALQVPGLPVNAGLTGAWTWFPKVK